MDDDLWLGDDEGEPLPVLELDADQPRPAGLPVHTPRKRRKPWAPRGGVKAEDAADVRRELLAEATGKALVEPEPWREEMRAGERGRAQSSLEAGGRKGNGRGFGLAG